MKIEQGIIAGDKVLAIYDSVTVKLRQGFINGTICQIDNQTFTLSCGGGVSIKIYYDDVEAMWPGDLDYANMVEELDNERMQ